MTKTAWSGARAGDVVLLFFETPALVLGLRRDAGRRMVEADVFKLEEGKRASLWRHVDGEVYVFLRLEGVLRGLRRA